MCESVRLSQCVCESVCVCVENMGGERGSQRSMAIRLLLPPTIFGCSQVKREFVSDVTQALALTLTAVLALAGG